MSGRPRIIPHQILPISPRPHLLRILPHPLTSLEDRLAAQHRHIDLLLADNQHLAATHVALRQDLDASLRDLRRAAAAAANARAEREAEVRGLRERSVRAGAEARAAEEMRVELMRVRGDAERLGRSRSELVERMKGMRVEVGRAMEEVGEMGDVRAEIEVMSREIQRGRAAVEYEKKARAENQVQSQEMENKMISMAREVEKLRIELANAEKRARASAAAAVAANPSLGYSDAYRSTGMAYGGNAYTMPYNLHQGADAGNQYGQVASSHAVYDTQHTHPTR